MEEEVLKLQKKLSQCQLERERLRNQNKTWIIKERQVTREKQELEKKLEIEKEATLCATSEFERKKKPLKEALEAKTKSLRQVQEVIKKFNDNQQREESYLEARSVIINDRLDRVYYIPEADRTKLPKLRSEIKKKRDELLAFLKTCAKNSKITDDVKPLLQLHYDAYIVGTLKTDVDDHCKKLRKYVHRVLQPSFAQKLNLMFAGALDLISPATNKHKHPVRGSEDDEPEHPGQASIA